MYEGFLKLPCIMCHSLKKKKKEVIQLWGKTLDEALALEMNQLPKGYSVCAQDNRSRHN